MPHSGVLDASGACVARVAGSRGLVHHARHARLAPPVPPCSLQGKHWHSAAPCPVRGELPACLRTVHACCWEAPGLPLRVGLSGGGGGSVRPHLCNVCHQLLIGRPGHTIAKPAISVHRAVQTPGHLHLRQQPAAAPDLERHHRACVAVAGAARRRAHDQRSPACGGDGEAQRCRLRCDAAPLAETELAALLSWVGRSFAATPTSRDHCRRQARPRARAPRAPRPSAPAP